MNQIQSISLPATAIARLVAAVASLPGVRFVGVTYRSKEANELARHVFILGASYENTCTASLDILRQREAIETDVSFTRLLQLGIASTIAGTPERKAANAMLAKYQDGIGPERAAAAELFISLEATLSAHAKGEDNAAYTKAGLYESICPGLKVSRADGTFELCGLSHSKRVIEPGTYKHVNSSAKTIAKDEIKRALPVGKFRTLALDLGALESVRISGNEVDVT
jgi:hypothetical protein